MNIFSIDTSFPPSLEQIPLVAMLTVMSFWAVFLICLQWIYEMVDDARDIPAPPRSYIRIARRVRLWLVSSALTLTAPRLLTLMLWQRFSAGEREMLSVISWVVCIPAAAMVVYAWWSNRAAIRTENEYVEEHGFYIAVPVTRTEKTRGAIILGLVFLIAFATTFVRSNTHVDAPPVSIVNIG